MARISSIHNSSVGVQPLASMGVHDEGGLSLMMEIKHGGEDGMVVALTEVIGGRRLGGREDAESGGWRCRSWEN